MPELGQNDVVPPETEKSSGAAGCVSFLWVTALVGAVVMIISSKLGRDGMTLNVLGFAAFSLAGSVAIVGALAIALSRSIRGVPMFASKKNAYFLAASTLTIAAVLWFGWYHYELAWIATILAALSCYGFINELIKARRNPKG